MPLSMDNFFWPSVFQILDFTLKFEETILEIVPASSFLLIGALVYLHYRRQPTYIRDGPLLFLKIGVAIVLVGLQAVSLALRSTSKAYQTNTTLSAAELDVVAACGLIILVVAEHRHAVRASAFIGLYLLLSLLIDTIEARSYFKRGMTSLGAISVASAVVRLTLLVLDEVPKVNLIIDPIIRDASGREATSGFWSRTLFFFMGPIFRVGFKLYFSRIQQFLCQEEHEDPRIMIGQIQSQISPDSAALVHFAEVTVAPRCSGTAILRNINLEIRPGSTTAVFGPTGSGKSTFIDAILGEADILDGQLFANDVAIAYCGQSAYLPNTTIQECIVGHCEYTESWFNTVVRSCQLAEDLQRLPGGKDYVVGPGGMALSGGQRVRVSIARAAFALAQLVVLDDSLSSLDGRTAQALLKGLFGEGGVLRQNRAAVVISSNMVDCVDFADQYVVLEGEGKFSTSTPRSDPNIRTRLEWLFSTSCTATSNSAPSEGEASTDQTSTLTATTTGNQEADDKLRQQGGRSLYSFWWRFAGRMPFGVWFVLIVLTGVADASPKIVLRYWAAKAAYERRYFIAYAILPFVAGGLVCVSLLVMFRVLAPRTARGLHAELTKTVFKASLGVLGAGDTGSIMNIECFNGVIVSWTHLETSIGALFRLQKFAQSTPKEDDGNTPLPADWPSAGKVEVDVRAARYEAAPDQPQRPPVLKEVSLSVDAGTRLGIVGRSGSGKTSLLLALLGFLQYDGSIKIDGVEVRDTNRDELRSRIVTITQDNVVLEGTIRQNLLPFDTAWGEQPFGPKTERENNVDRQKDAILQETLVRLQIWDSLEEAGKLDAVVGKVGYSHGELQMLCIARAVVRRRLTGSRLVLVDEGTSTVDRWRDLLVRETIQQYFSKCTIIVIAHRDETIVDASAIVTLSHGKVVQRQ
ncbi:ABC transporter [Akanthomyces lecanii RCEF 1005]|uniref:ABC transporter n=1 Tax=Akanthomyces lecanii RCEF 1005 TaxID=1081108 RepID=A0A168G5J4_CORDF|nr:ABC transporter [Akanthomyces lecanii RCEF 1005]